MITTNETYPWSFVTQIFNSSYPGLRDDRLSKWWLQLNH